MKLTDITTLSKNKINSFIAQTGIDTVEGIQRLDENDRALRARGIGKMFFQIIRNIDLKDKKIYTSQEAIEMATNAVKGMGLAEYYQKQIDQAELRGYNRALDDMAEWIKKKPR